MNHPLTKGRYFNGHTLDELLTSTVNGMEGMYLISLLSILENSKKWDSSTDRPG